MFGLRYLNHSFGIRLSTNGLGHIFHSSILHWGDFLFKCKTQYSLSRISLPNARLFIAHIHSDLPPRYLQLPEVPLHLSITDLI